MPLLIWCLFNHIVFETKQNLHRFLYRIFFISLKIVLIWRRKEQSLWYNKSLTIRQPCLKFNAHDFEVVSEMFFLPISTYMACGSNQTLQPYVFNQLSFTISVITINLYSRRMLPVEAGIEQNNQNNFHINMNFEKQIKFEEMKYVETNMVEWRRCSRNSIKWFDVG